MRPAACPLKIFALGLPSWSNTDVHTDFSVELGPDEPALELPWASPDGTQRYYDLKRRPELLLEIQEAHDNRELGEFLVTTNSAVSVLETAKCDTWLSDELAEE